MLLSSDRIPCASKRLSYVPIKKALVPKLNRLCNSSLLDNIHFRRNSRFFERAVISKDSIPVLLKGVEESVGVNASIEALSENAAVLSEVVNSDADTISQLSEVAQQVSKPGVVDAAAIAIEQGIQLLSDKLDAAHVPYSFGISIVLTTCLLKLAMYPLIEQQVRLPLISKHVAPAIAALKSRYEKSDPDRFKRSVTQLYHEYGISPGMMLVQNVVTLPVFFLLFKALRRAAADGAMDEPFFFIPSLAGPHRDGLTGLQWLLPLANGHPPVGWPLALSYLTIPAALVVLSIAAQEEVFTPKERRVRSGKASNAKNQASPANLTSSPSSGALKYLSPLLMGWFSLQVPAGLSLYWLTNTAINTAIETKLKSGPLPKPVDLAKYGIATEGSTAAAAKATPSKETSQGSSSREGGAAAAAKGEVSAASAEGSAAKKKSGSRFRALKAEESLRKLAKK